jgi:DNA repair protein RecN (Recombination protein N)
MEKAGFVVRVDPLPMEQWNAYGMDQVRFLVSTNPGTEAGPLNKIASGGEMARFMLALRVVMAQTETGRSIIFDEIDAGVGGAVADAIGERLARLANDHQVMVVTHAPQIAARASHQWIVAKDGADVVTTDVRYLNETDKRREEIARMLSGATITSEARAAADKLLESAAA